MKKLVSILLAVFLLVACGTTDGMTPSEPSQSSGSLPALSVPAPGEADVMIGSKDFIVVSRAPESLYGDLVEDYDPETMVPMSLFELLGEDDYLFIPMDKAQRILDAAGDVVHQHNDNYFDLMFNFVLQFTFVQDNIAINSFQNYDVLFYPAQLDGGTEAYLNLLDSLLEAGVRVSRHDVTVERKENFPSTLETLNEASGFATTFRITDARGYLPWWDGGLFEAGPYINLEYYYDNNGRDYNELAFFDGRPYELGLYPCDDVFLPVIEFFEEQNILYGYSGAYTNEVVSDSETGALGAFSRQLTVYLTETPSDDYLADAQAIWAQCNTLAPYDYDSKFNVFDYDPNPLFFLSIYMYERTEKIELDNLQQQMNMRPYHEDDFELGHQFVDMNIKANVSEIPPCLVDGNLPDEIELPDWYYPLNTNITDGTWAYSYSIPLLSAPASNASEVAILPPSTAFYRLGYQPMGETAWEFVEVDGQFGWIRYSAAALDIAEEAPMDVVADKPVIYLYPEQETEISVRLNIPNGQLICTYPEYGTGWNVTAWPDGRIVNHADGLEYSYLFWEGVLNTEYDLSEGFVIKGEDTVAFLQHTLAYMGLTPKEYNEFIVYWLPQMQSNAYNLITFQNVPYTTAAQLEIYPQPDSILRVFMAFKPLDSYIELPQPTLQPFERTGFTVIEWGGTRLG